MLFSTTSFLQSVGSSRDLLELWAGLLDCGKPASSSQHPYVYMLSSSLQPNIRAVQPYSFESDSCLDEENKDVWIPSSVELVACQLQHFWVLFGAIVIFFCVIVVLF